MFNNIFTKKDSVVDAVSQVLESWDEDDDVARADRELKRMKAKPIEADKKTDPDKEIGKLAKKTPKEMDEELKGSQHKLDVAKPKGKLTAADFKKLRKEDAEQIDEISKDLATRYLNKAKGSKSLSDLSGKRKEGSTLALRKKWGDKNFGFDEPKVKATEEVVIEKTLSPAESKKKEEIVKSMKKDKAGLKARYGKRWKEVAYATATKSAKRVAEDMEQIDELSKKTLGSYIKKAATKIRVSSRLGKEFENDAKRAKKSKEDKEFWAKHYANKASKRTSGVKLAADKLTREEVEQIDELSKKTLRYYMRANTKRMSDPKNPDSMERKMKRHDDYFKASKKVNEGNVSESQGPTSTYGVDPNFVPPENTTSSPVLARAKELARGALKRLNDSMLGKAGTTSEEIDTSVKSTDTLKGRLAGGKKDDVGPGADGKSTKVKYIPGPK